MWGSYYNLLTHPNLAHNRTTITGILYEDHVDVCLDIERTYLIEYLWEQKNFRTEVVEENKTAYTYCTFPLRFTIFDIVNQKEFLCCVVS
jgi:hypothetical protein